MIRYWCYFTSLHFTIRAQARLRGKRDLLAFLSRGFGSGWTRRSQPTRARSPKNGGTRGGSKTPKISFKLVVYVLNPPKKKCNYDGIGARAKGGSRLPRRG